MCDLEDNNREVANDNYCDESYEERGKNNGNRRGETVLEARRKWALIHFYSLRPAFSISLILYLASITSGRGMATFQTGVIHPIRNLASLVQMESKAYTKCVQKYTNRTATRLQELALKDRERVKGILESNAKVLKQGAIVANGCLQDAEKARESLARWRDDEMVIPWKEVVFHSDSSNFKSTCSAKKRNRTEELLGRNHRMAERQMSNTLQSLMSESHNSLKNVGDYALERFDYDWNYFIRGRIQPALDFIAEQAVYIQPSAIDLSYNITEIEQRLQEQILIVQQVLQRSKDHINILKDKLEEFRGSINGFYVSYNELYGRMVKATEIVSEFLPPGISLPDVFDLSNVHLADSFMPPTGLMWPELELEYTDIRRVSQNLANACLDLLVGVLDDIRVQSWQGLHVTVQDLARSLTEILELKNYHPPQYHGSQNGILDVDEEVELQSRRGQEILNWTGKVLSHLRNRPSVFHDVTADEIQAPIGRTFDYNYTEEKSSTFELLDILMPEFSLLEYILSTVATLGDYAFMFDILCCLTQWWKLSSIYEKGAMPNMPQIDYCDGDQDSKVRPQANYKIFLFIAKSFLNPIFLGFLCIFSFIAFFVITFWVPHVEEMCVHSTNGTWFANNMLGPTLSNIAMAEGNSQYLLAENFCYSSKNQLCANIQMQMETRFLADLDSLEDLKTRHSHSLDTLKLIDECVHISNMTAMVSEACCGLKGHTSGGCFSTSNYTCPIDFSTSPPSAYRGLASYLESSSCLEDLHRWTLSDEKQECASLNKACRHIPCSGVDYESIQKLSNDTDCKVELWIIASCRFWASATIQFIALYTICTLLYLGCRDFHWRKISPDSIGLRTHLLENGALVKGNQLEDRSRMISDEIKWFERKARIQISLGAALLSIYAIVLLALCMRG